ncbi:MAG: family 78 glycoside hydrolase catalytic domain [Planctomycetes bacterium]|nr:family 78 glycoside hydrolase catalytic domain [Planctomycetota bacterium]
MLVALAFLTFASPNRAPQEGEPATTRAVRPARSEPTNLRMEWLVEPLGVIDERPRFSWELADSRPGAKQTAYRIQVATSVEKLARDQADVWDSGVVQSSATVGVEYGGSELPSLASFVWTVTNFDAEGVGLKARLAQRFGTGPRSAEELGASWIQVPPLTTPRRRAHNGFHSEWAERADAVKWVQLDLRGPTTIDSVTLWPTQPFDGPAWPEFLFPLELELQCDDDPRFEIGVRTLVRWTSAGSSRAALEPLVLKFPATRARSLRVVVTRLAENPEGRFGFTLAELEARSFQDDVEWVLPATPRASDTLEIGAWSLANLVDGDTTSHRAEEDPPGPTTLFAKPFRLESPPVSATLRATAAGLYRFWIDGNDPESTPVAPLWTTYDVRAELATYSGVEKCLRAGWNELRFEVADGWFAGRVGLAGIVPGGFTRGLYGRQPALLARLDVECANGEHVTVVSDGSWFYSQETTIRSADLLDGVTVDPRQPARASSRTAPDGSELRLHSPDRAELDWRMVHAWPDFARDGRRVQLDPERCQRIACIDLVEPKRVAQVAPLTWLLDFGQNCTAGFSFEARATPEPGVVVRYGEALGPDGRLYRDNLRGAAQTDRFVSVPSVADFESTFTLHGYRYAEVEGLAAAPERAFQSVVGHLANETGTFESSSELLNRLWQAIRWTQRSNLIGIPTDCPQRDERLGWMGDIQVFAPTACYQQDLAAFFTKWMFDVRDAQARDGRFPDFAPHPFDPNARFSGAPAWADAGVLVPWTAYTFYGDRRLLEEHIEAAERWVEFVRATNPDGVWRNERGNDYGDWLNGDWIALAGWKKEGANVPKDLFATAFHARSAQTLSKLEAALGRRPQAAEFAKLFETIRQAFVREFVKPDGSLPGDTQAGYALALEFDLLPEFARELALERLVADIDARGGHLSTGIQATPRALFALSNNGRHELACKLVLDTRCPSWGYMLEQGATTIWERWDGFVPGRGFQDPGMNSFNHFAFGSVGEWMMATLAGIEPDETHPGFERFFLRPRPGPGLDWVRASYASVRGTIASAWRRVDGEVGGEVGVVVEYEFTVPPNTLASVALDATAADVLFEGAEPSKRTTQRSAGRLLFELAPGTHHFRVARPRSRRVLR